MCYSRLFPARGPGGASGLLPAPLCRPQSVPVSPAMGALRKEGGLDSQWGDSMLCHGHRLSSGDPCRSDRWTVSWEQEPPAPVC